MLPIIEAAQQRLEAPSDEAKPQLLQQLLKHNSRRQQELPDLKTQMEYQ